MNKLFFFSNNFGKIKEIDSLFVNSGLKIYSLKNFFLNKEPKETGRNFIENAKIKSVYGFTKTGIPCFADDSGICIEALKWGPGVHSKRFLNSFKDNGRCFDYIINLAKERNLFNAYFRTSISFTIKNNYHVVFEGTVKGKINKKISGKNGFGFDPIFVPDGSKKTFASMSLIEKNKISHRSIAILKLKNFLIN